MGANGDIRLLNTKDMEDVVELWLRGSLESHDFIDPDYWRSMKVEMREKYLPMATSYVIEDDGAIVGFVSMVDEYLAALFVEGAQQNKGYGKQLVNYIKELYASIHLRVYQNNVNATRFYQKNGFFIVEEGVDGRTSQKEYVMSWSKGTA